MKTIISILSCLLCTIAYGQFFPVNLGVDLGKYELLDSVRVSFLYKMVFSWDPEKPEIKSTDMQILDIGDRMSSYYSRYLVIDYPKFAEKNKGFDFMPNNPEKGSQPYVIYKNYPVRGHMTVVDISKTFERALYVYEDPMPSFDWKLHDEFMTILDYRCQKATTTFLGRDYTAWFATELPFNNGPWKFRGLPGLILKVTDSENQYDFECIGIENSKNQVVKYYDGKFTKINRKDLLRLYHRMHNDLAGFYESLGIKVLVGNSSSSRIPPIPYNPIERE